MRQEAVIDALIFISQRPIVITLAIFGALLVIAGSLNNKPEQLQPGGMTASALGRRRSLSKHLTAIGYVITFASILLFIIAGFVSDLRP